MLMVVDWKLLKGDQNEKKQIGTSLKFFFLSCLELDHNKDERYFFQYTSYTVSLSINVKNNIFKKKKEFAYLNCIEYESGCSIYTLLSYSSFSSLFL